MWSDLIPGLCFTAGSILYVITASTVITAEHTQHRGDAKRHRVTFQIRLGSISLRRQEHWRQTLADTWQLNASTGTWVHLLLSHFVHTFLHKHTQACPKTWIKRWTCAKHQEWWYVSSGSLLHFISHNKGLSRGNWLTYCWAHLAVHSSLTYRSRSVLITPSGFLWFRSAALLQFIYH